MAEPGWSTAALPDDKVLVLVCIYLVVMSLSLVGSGSILALIVLRRRCCTSQVRPLFLLSLSDFLAALALSSSAAIQLLPPRLFLPAYPFCPHLLSLGMTFYAVSFLMVVVYAQEVKRVLSGWRAAPSPALQDTRSWWCHARLQPSLPYILAWLLPLLVFLALLWVRGISLSDTASWLQAPIRPHPAPGTYEPYSFYCSRCLILIRPSWDICYTDTSKEDSGKEGKIFFLVFVALVGAACTVLYCRVKGCCSWNEGAPLLRQEAEGGTGGSWLTCCYFQVVFLVCWMPAFLLGLLSFTSLQPTDLFLLYVATAASVSSQGFLHSLVYGWLRRNFRQEVNGERLPLYRSPDLKAFYDDSLAASDGE